VSKDVPIMQLPMDEMKVVAGKAFREGRRVGRLEFAEEIAKSLDAHDLYEAAKWVREKAVAP